MIKRSAAEKVMYNRRRIIQDLIGKNAFSIPSAARYFGVSETAIKNDLDKLGKEAEEYREPSEFEEAEIKKLDEEFRAAKIGKRDYDKLYERGFYYLKKEEKVNYSFGDCNQSNPDRFKEAVNYYRDNYIPRSYVYPYLAEKFNVDKQTLASFIKENQLPRHEIRIAGKAIYKDNKACEENFLECIPGERKEELLHLLKDSTGNSVAEMLGIPVIYVRHLLWDSRNGLMKREKKQSDDKIGVKRSRKDYYAKRSELIGALYYEESRMYTQELIAALLHTNRTTVHHDLLLYMKEHGIQREEKTRDKHKVLRGKLNSEDACVYADKYLTRLKEKEDIWRMLEDYEPDQFKERLTAYFLKIANPEDEK